MEDMGVARSQRRPRGLPGRVVRDMSRKPSPSFTRMRGRKKCRDLSPEIMTRLRRARKSRGSSMCHGLIASSTPTDEDHLLMHPDKKRRLFRDTCVRQLAHQGLPLLATQQARPLRFILTGSLAGLSQIGLLAVLLRLAVSPLLANGIAFLLAAQLNFLLSLLFTWRDRHEINRASLQLLQRWFAFHGAILGTAILNQLIFALTQIWLPALLAAGLGIVSAAIANFFLLDRLVFRPSCRSPKRKDLP